jgi:hypothetical protein
MKKIESKKSRDTVPLNRHQNHVDFLDIIRVCSAGNMAVDFWPVTEKALSV